LANLRPVFQALKYLTFFRFPAKRPKCNSPILDDLDSIPIPQDNSRRISDPRLRRHPQSGAKIVHRKDISEDRQVESDFLNDRKVRSDTSNDRENRSEAKNDRQNRSDAKSDRQQRSDDSNGRKTQSDTLNVRQIRITKNIVETSQNESRLEIFWTHLTKRIRSQ
jgi:hypothetical protein